MELKLDNGEVYPITKPENKQKVLEAAFGITIVMSPAKSNGKKWSKSVGGRANAHWTKGEDDNLIRIKTESPDRSWPSIAAELKRTTHACKARLITLKKAGKVTQ